MTPTHDTYTYIHICVYIYMYICIHIYVFVYVYVYTYLLLITYAGNALPPGRCGEGPRGPESRVGASSHRLIDYRYVAILEYLLEDGYKYR